jgi:hypothetical protein
MDFLNWLRKNVLVAIVGSTEVTMHLSSNRGVFTVPYLDARENTIDRAHVDLRR